MLVFNISFKVHGLSSRPIAHPQTHCSAPTMGSKVSSHMVDCIWNALILAQSNSFKT